MVTTLTEYAWIMSALDTYTLIVLAFIVPTLIVSTLIVSTKILPYLVMYALLMSTLTFQQFKYLEIAHWSRFKKLVKIGILLSIILLTTLYLERASFTRAQQWL